MYAKKNIFYRVFQLLSPEQRRKGLAVTFLLVISSLLDFFSLASFLPLILLVINPGLIQTSSLMQGAYHFFGFINSANPAITLTLLILLFIVFKTRMNHWIAYRKAAYAYGVGNEMASLAITHYLKVPYEEFTHADFSKELNRLSNVPLTFANNIIIPAGTLISEMLVLLILCFAIAFYQFKVFSLFFLILIPAYFIYRFKRKQASGISAAVGVVYPRLLKYTMQIVEGLVDIRSFHKESFFKTRFKEANNKVGSVFSKDHTSQTETARTTELVAAFCVCMMLIYSLVSRQNQQETLLLLSIYAGVSFRIVPSINRIFSALHQIRTNEHVINELPRIVGPEEDDLEDSAPVVDFHTSIILSNISFAYSGHNQILQKVNLEIRKGEKIAITGTSGKGKTTLFLMLLGLLPAQNGEIFLDNTSIRGVDPGAWRKLFGYVPQQPYVLAASIAENIAFGIPIPEINKAKIISLLTDLELMEWINSLPDGVHTAVGEKGLKISGGQRQRLAIARALYHDREILLLDEVTNQLDPGTEAEIFKLLKKVTAGKTIIMITHHPDLLKHFDHVYELADGKLHKTTRLPLFSVS